MVTHRSDDERGMDGVRRRSALKLGAAGIAGIGPLSAYSAGVARGAPSATPVGVHVAYGDDPTTSLNVGWTGGTADTARVEYGTSGLDETAMASTRTLPTDDESQPVAYTASLTGLEPGTTYRYRAVMDGEASKTFAVETAPEAGGSFRVTAVGDHGIADPDNPGQRPDTDDPEKVVARAQAQDPAFHIGVGDLSYSNGKPSTWELYFDTFEEFYATTPFVTVPGNHEAEVFTGLQQYDARLNQLMPETTGTPPNEKRWYDFQYGNALFIGLNTTSEDCAPPSRFEEQVPIYDPRCNFDTASDSISDQQRALYETQREFLEKTLSEAAEDDSIEWNIVYFHGPLWTDSPDHAPRQVLREEWGTLFDKYDVDLVLHGDNHVYERTCTVSNKRALESGSDAEGIVPAGTTYIVNGTGGVNHYAFNEGVPEWTDVRSNEFFGVTQLDIDDERLRVRYVVEDGSVIDEFAIAKTPDGEPVQVDPALEGVAGDRPPTDPDCDGLYEDVTGDLSGGLAETDEGFVKPDAEGYDVVDVQTLFANRESDAVRSNPEAFDFNRDGRTDVVDVQKLFRGLSD